MGLFDFFKGGKAKASKPFDAAWSKIFLQYSSEITSQDQDTETFIKKGYQSNPTVYSIVSTVAKNAGLAKWKVYKKGPDGTKTPYNDKLLEELMYRPNALMTWNQLIQEAVSFKMLTGNTYIWGIPGSNTLTSDKLTSLYVLPSQDVQIHVNGNQRSINGYSIDFYGRSEEEMIPADQVLHLKNFNPQYNTGNDHLYGQSPLRAATTALMTNNDALTTARSYLLNQGPRGILWRKEDMDFGPMSEEQVNDLRNRFASNHTGTKKAGELLIVPGEGNYDKIGSSAADLELIQHYNLTVNDICNIYNFPTILLGNGETTFANLKEAKKALWSNVIIPALTELRDALNSWLIPSYGSKLCIDFDTSDIMELQEDLKTQSDAVSKLQNIITVNEARGFIGLAPLDGPEGEEIFRFVQGTEQDRDASEEQNSNSSEQEGSE